MGHAICGISTYTFYKCIRQLNPKLRICDLDNSSHAAGLYYIDPREGWIQVCGVDKKWVPVATTVDEVGHILKSGWVRVVRILLAQGFTTPARVRQVWPNFYLSRIPKAEFHDVDPILNKIGKFVTEEENKRGEQGMTSDQIFEVAEDVRKTETSWKKEKDEEAKWNLNKALDKNQKSFI
jgi:hypothetical protein